MAEEDQVYKYLVVDSGPIIRLTGMSTLWKKAKSFYTVPAVLDEIKDAKARHHLENLPFDLLPKDPSPEAVKAIIDFARQTGDYQSLSSVDIQVLALAYDLEKEGCNGDIGHIRTTPKRTLGVGKIEMMNKGESKTEIEIVEDEGDSSDDEDGLNPAERAHEDESTTRPMKPQGPPKSWAALLNPDAGSTPSVETTEINVSETNVHVPFGQLKLSNNEVESGQFSDAEEDDPGNEVRETETDEHITTVDEELKLEFPSLAAAATVAYDGSDNEQETVDEEERKKKSLQPISKSGKLYKKDPIVKKLTKPSKKTESKKSENIEIGSTLPEMKEPEKSESNIQSRIMGGTNLAGQGADVEDDGEGWISTTAEIQTLKANGSLDPVKSGKSGSNLQIAKPMGPPIESRAACTTTDFAMQNVLLQMNLELLSVDGMKVKKLKSWVRRCGSCFKVYTDAEDTGPLSGKRLFCERCGSDMIQRIACSVDGKSGRLRLHLSKKYKHNLRGTKFSLPKPGSGDRFQGDLLLREDQLMMGTWNQKAKMRNGGKAKAAAESIFGRDIAKNVGCHVNSMSGDDIQVGFGRRNPNAAKGRERRGKKKKSSTRACGLRRY